MTTEIGIHLQDLYWLVVLYRNTDMSGLRNYGFPGRLRDIFSREGILKTCLHIYISDNFYWYLYSV
jgi:hypothetical protein